MGVAVDATGAVYVAGGTSSTDFPVTPNAAQRQYGGAEAGFLPSGDAFVVRFGEPPPPTPPDTTTHTTAHTTTDAATNSSAHATTGAAAYSSTSADRGDQRRGPCRQLAHRRARV